ncbi:cysteine dioxygenase [Halomonas sp. AOP13-D3-9]
MADELRLDRLRNFISEVARQVDRAQDEEALLDALKPLLAKLVSHDDWLPTEFTQPHPEYYQQYLLHADSQQRFSIVSFVWGPGQRTPIHDHRVWGVIGMLRGAELSQGFIRTEQGELRVQGEPTRLNPGDVEAVSPSVGDIHQVSNALNDQTSISIHIYGANIGAVKRAVYAADGKEKVFISGYSNQFLPNIWDVSKETTLP